MSILLRDIPLSFFYFAVLLRYLLARSRRSFEIFGVQNTSKVTLLHSLQRKSGNNSSADTASIFGGEDLDRVFFSRVFLSRPVENLSESLCASCLEMRVFVEYGAVGAHVAGLKVLLDADSSNSTSRQASRTCADQFSGSTD